MVKWMATPRSSDLSFSDTFEKITHTQPTCSTFDASGSLVKPCNTYTSCFDRRTAPLYEHCMLEIRMANKKVPSKHHSDLRYPLISMFLFICDMSYIDNINHLPTYTSKYSIQSAHVAPLREIDFRSLRCFPLKGGQKSPLTTRRLFVVNVSFPILVVKQ